MEAFGRWPLAIGGIGEREHAAAASAFEPTANG
jgi:hypothetical protein